MITSFYEKLLLDPEFKHIFLEVAEIDILEHLDIMIDFWESVLFQAGNYKRDVLGAHLNLNQQYNYGINKTHFKKWLKVFNQNMDELFEGEIAEGAKNRALSIATIIKLKIENLEKSRREINN
ncbi:MAG: group III truncated hemoglobin [Bacteroidota bacterium]